MSSTTLLRPARDDESATLLAWRNHPAVRQVMFTDHLISVDEHARWWAQMRQNDGYRLLVIEHGGVPCGVVTFSAIAKTDAAWLWGFYFNPDAFADGLERLRAWSGMEHASVLYAQDHLAARSVRCEVFSFNTAVLSMHLRHGFRETGRYDRQRGAETLQVVQLARAV